MTDCLFALHGGVATLTLDSPRNHNALGKVITMQLRDHLAKCASDPSVRVVVITATGAVFSSGWDLNQDPSEGLLVDGLLIEVLEMIRNGDKPVVAKIGGHAFGGALGIVAACDLSVASRNATFTFSEVRLGLAPTTAAVHCVPRMRLADALELMLIGERFSAERAVEVGLVNRAVEPSELDEAVDAVTTALMLGGPQALAACKRLARDISHPGPDAYELASYYNASLVGSAEATEGISAFVERRSPRWIVDDA
jgi:methylglutaconyl-CoA hydratase